MLRGIGLLLIALCAVNAVLLAKVITPTTRDGEVVHCQLAAPLVVPQHVQPPVTPPVKPEKKFILPIETKPAYIPDLKPTPVSYVTDLNPMPEVPTITPTKFVTPVQTQATAAKRAPVRQPCKLITPNVVGMPSCTKKGQPYQPPVEDVQE